MPDTDNDLQTQYVFIDTQAFVQSKLDWDSRSLAKLIQLVRTGHITMLTTSITKREVYAQIGEALSRASAALKKHDVVLRQSNIPTIEPESARSTLLSKFDTYLITINAFEVPLTHDTEAVVSAYFDCKPPFSEKKKAEFPDAIVVASLREWCSTGRSAYVVSDDPDMRASCDGSKLISVSSIAEIISKALVREKLHDSLLAFAEQNNHLKEFMREKVLREDAAFQDDHTFEYPIEIHATVVDATYFNILTLDVTERTGDTFSCEMQVEFELTVQVGRGHLHHNQFYANRTDNIILHRIFSVEADIRFQRSGDSSNDQISNIHLYPLPIELEASELPRWS
jgi:hypothetical protein